MTEYEKIHVRHQLTEIMRGPQGRTFGRIFTTERNKEDGNFVKLKREVTDIWNEVIDALYLEPPPTQL